MSHDAFADPRAEGAGEAVSAMSAERRGELVLALLAHLGRRDDLAEVLRALLGEIVASLDLSGAAIRIAEGDDYVLCEAVGLDERFVARERSLRSARNGAGCLDCMCGRVLDGLAKPEAQYFSARGSFWTGDLQALLAGASAEERMMFSRATCLSRGFASMALVPLSSGGETVGLLQLVDRRRGRFDAAGVGYLESLAEAVGVAVRWRLEEDRSRRQSGALREANERLKLLVEGSPRFFFYVQERDASVSYVSPSVEAVTGRPVSEWLGQRHWFSTDNPLNDRARERTHEHLAGRLDPRPVLCEVEHADGYPILLEVFEFGRYREGELVGVHGIAHDVTDEHRARRERDRLFELSLDLLCIADFDGWFRQLNPAWERALGWTAEELAARPYLELVHPDDLEATRAVADRLAAGQAVAGFVNRYRHRDGSYRWLSWSSSAITNERLVFAVAHDVTEARQAAAASSHRARQLAAVNRIARRTASLTDLDDLFRTTAAEVHEALGYHSVGILAVDHGRRRLRAVEMAGAYAPIASRGYQQSIDVGLLGEVARTGRTVVCNDVSVDPRYELGFEVDPGTRAEVGVPVVVDGEVVAVIDVHENRTGAFSDADATILGTVADQLAVAVRNNRLYEQARASEERDRQLFLAHPVPMWVYDLESLRFLDVNNAAVHHYGYSRDEFLAMTIEDIRPAEDLPVLRESVDQSRRDGGYERSRAWRHRTKAGELIWVNIDSNELVFEGRAARVVTAYDVTDRLAAAAALEESEARYRVLFEAESDAVFLIDNETGRLLEANAAAETMYGFPREQLLQMRNTDLSAEPQATRKVTSESRGHAGVPLRWHRKADGSVFPVEITGSFFEFQGRPVHIAAIRDISARLRAEEELRASEERYRRFFEDDITGDYISTAEGRIVACNPAFAEIFGFDSAEQALATDLTVLYPTPGDRARFLAELRRERSLKSHQLELRRRDGEAVHVVENAYGEFDERGELVQVKGYIFDITAHKRTEEQLRHAQKLEAMGRLAGGVAHDFNNLLQAVLSTLQYLRLSDAGPDALAVASRELEEQVQRGAGLARQLLLFARRGVTRPEKLDLNAVVADTVRLLRRVIPANVRLEVSHADGPLVVDGDRGQLEQVLTNLALNGADAMPDGGRLEVATWADNGQVGLTVRDDGTGMDDATRARIFEPFFTTKGELGTGLGLSVVHGIVTSHGGSIEVDTEPGRGTTFWVRLPRHASGAFPGVRAAAAGGSPATGTAERVLLVEDNQQIRGLFARMLERLGYRVTAVGSAEEALALASEPPFALLLSDVMLPGASGVELSRRLGERWPELQVILVSGYAEDEVSRSDVTAGHLRFLQKPVDLATLAAEVRAALGERSS